MSEPVRGRLQVLGSSGGVPLNGMPCSGYRFATPNHDILLDCGPGVAGALFASQETCDLDAVFISHLHPDHVLDLMPLAYGLMGEWISNGRTRPLPLLVPEGGIAFLQRFSDLFGHRHWRFGPEHRGRGHAMLREVLARDEDWFFAVFDVEEYAAGDAWRYGDIAVKTAPVTHSIPTAAIRLDIAGQALVYTGDTRWDERLPDFAAGASLLLADAHFSSASAPGGAHMTPREAGRLAQQAQVKTLVLCHLASPRDAESAVQAAAGEFDGIIRVAARDREFAL